MSILLAVLLSYAYSPGDSSWNLVTLGNIPERAILFAELAAKEGGRSAVDLATMLEMAGRFTEAEHCYSLALNSANDPLLSEWLENRISGSRTLDTLVILSTVISNMSDADAIDISVEIPLPVSHTPYQRIELLASAFVAEGNLMAQHIDLLPSRTTLVLPLILHITQHPYNFRPLPAHYPGIAGSVSLEDISSLIRSIPMPETETGPGPCLEIAYLLRDRAADAGLELHITGGLLRTGTDSLLFHAWNQIPVNGMPIDAALFFADSLRGIGHCPTDIIPLWNYEYTDGHEVSVFYPQQNINLDISMQAAFADPDFIERLLKLFPMCLITRK
ncbi:MAG: hypothetical protein GQ565_02345 [Candidatus Aegiribacteria sp.]|nr:hypothetical protein [Candidatus Aegiribacteria sp.]